MKKKFLFWRNPLTVIAMLLLVVLISAILCSAYVYNSYTNDIHWVVEHASVQNWSGDWPQIYEDALAQKEAYIENNIVAFILNAMSCVKVLRAIMLFGLAIILFAALWWLAKAPMKPRHRRPHPNQN